MHTTKTPMLTTTSPAVAFFFEHAGHSYDPRTETPEQGRLRCAEAMAAAETVAREAGCSFQWETDTVDSSDFSEEEPWNLWSCLAYNAEGVIFASLGGVDFGRDGEPWGNPYRRVVEAELAEELNA